MTRIARFIVVIVTLLTPSNVLEYLQHAGTTPTALHNRIPANIRVQAS